MIRLAAFFLGLGLVLAAWPQVQFHHVKAEMMQLAWCSSHLVRSSGLSSSSVQVACRSHAIHKHGDILRVGVASASNDHRLGAQEAPPVCME